MALKENDLITVRLSPDPEGENGRMRVGVVTGIESDNATINVFGVFGKEREDFRVPVGALQSLAITDAQRKRMAEELAGACADENPYKWPFDKMRRDFLKYDLVDLVREYCDTFEDKSIIEINQPRRRMTM